MSEYYEDPAPADHHEYPADQHDSAIGDPIGQFLYDPGHEPPHHDNAIGDPIAQFLYEPGHEEPGHEPGQYDEAHPTGYAEPTGDGAYASEGLGSDGQPAEYTGDGQPAEYNGDGQPSEYNGDGQPSEYTGDGQPSEYTGDGGSEPTGYATDSGDAVATAGGQNVIYSSEGAGPTDYTPPSN